jgi:hypothetical protein
MTFRVTFGFHVLIAAMAVAAQVAAAQAAGALAIGDCGAYGYSFDYPNLGAARAGALVRCEGNNCRVVATMRRGCAAFVVDGHNACTAHGYAVARSLGEAQNIALRYCAQYGGRDCVIRAWACDGSG